jgi:hypothetical protein
MCNIGAIAALIASASIALIAAIVAFGVAAVNAGTFWGAFGNSIPMGIAAALIGVAFGAINAAAALMSPCRNGPCKALADRLFTALASLATALAVLLAAVIVGMFGASIPYAGIAVAIALAAGGVACSITLGFISNELSALDSCRRAPAAPETTEVTIAKVAAGVASVVGFFFAFATGATGVPSCINGNCG